MILIYRLSYTDNWAMTVKMVHCDDSVGTAMKRDFLKFWIFIHIIITLFFHCSKRDECIKCYNYVTLCVCCFFFFLYFFSFILMRRNWHFSELALYHLMVF